LGSGLAARKRANASWTSAGVQGFGFGKRLGRAGASAARSGEFALRDCAARTGPVVFFAMVRV
jgi:hypothetical protein